MRRIMVGAASGVLAAGFGVAAAELLAAATRPQAGPLVAVGGAVIDATPTAVKEFAVRTLGTYDKPVLLAAIVAVLLLFTAVTGILGLRRRVAVVAGAVVFGAAGAAAALSRPATEVFDPVPSLFGAATAGAVLWWLLRRPASEPALVHPGSARAPAVGPATTDVPQREFDRRVFLRSAALVAGGAVTAGGSAQWLNRARAGTAASTREALRLPAPASPARPLPAGTAPGFVTANTEFYRVDTALTIPRIDLGTWRLRLHGMVDNEFELSFDALLDRPLIERDITLNCVSNEVGGPYIGTARWLGVPLAPLLREAGPRAGADQLIARSAEGMTIGTPIDVLLDGRDAMLVVGMNGEPLPLVNGFPVRMLTPGLYGYAGACKWLTELRVTTFADVDAYWVERGWAARAPVKTASRIDRPKPFARLTAGTQTIAGVAWAQGRGIGVVEISVDGGEWSQAELLPVPSTDTWVQWRYPWTATAGPHSIAVRATDTTGARQTEQRATPFPDGATGWHTITVTIT
ncbi:molybdopterin-dependent oxidoreductase [Catenuloplanes atrovinosus]|uniref:DMSO/TMAO reductase YedYZ molybdopterin-dependent catalytic subunit n=1 Tax=Catenuloplanes atrovinosus TaxID=137266 RepID=A0AAE3YNP3_9ACTN|nr:molybdopterin-dependent oxidoreductase [Catenuloplanes atrovinosus]MDR7277159.1 DMSO/TMAO reductase YedYZ molybdopterin-dependent catalytic subunit [Catenuloplanes atrovinosus]